MKTRSNASEVWELPLVGGKLRILLKPGQETLIRLEVVDNSPAGTLRFAEMDVHAWRSLCDLRNRVRPARQKRSTP